MAAKVFQTGLLTQSSAGDIGWSRVPLGLLHGERAATALQKAGVAVHLGETVEKVQVSEGLFTVRTGTGETEADGVVVALPHYSTEDVLPAGTLPAQIRPSQLASSPIVNVHVHFDRRVTDLAFAAGVGTAAQWVFDRTASSGAGTGQYLAVSMSGADEYVAARPADLAAEVTSSLRSMFPRAKDAEVLRTFVTKELHATFRASPGASAHRAPARTQVPGLALAGAWTATGWPPTMESAIRSGGSAANVVLSETGLSETGLSGTRKRSGLPPLEKLQEVM
jgi:protoporphyrinogen oxidase